VEILSKINHQISGKGPQKLVFLHGLIGSGNNWSRVVKLFDPNLYTILTYDQRGHGRSFQPLTGYNANDFASDLLHILDELNWSQIDLIGHSMGGRVALTFASLYQTRLRSLTIEDIGVEPRPSNTSKIESYITRVPTPFSDRKSAKSYLFGPFLESLKDASNAKDLANFFYANLTEKESGPQKNITVDWRFFKQGILETLKENQNIDRSDIWAKVKVPALLIRGETSTDLTQGEFERMLKLNPSCKGVVVPEAGHWVHFDQPVVFFEHLNTFLKSF
jgi:esterase